MPRPPNAFATKRFTSGPVREITYRKKYASELLNPRRWKKERLVSRGMNTFTFAGGEDTELTPSVTFYRTPGGLRLVVRKYDAKSFRRAHLPMPRLTETMGILLAKRVPFERPLAHYRDPEGNHVHVSERVGGPTLYQLAYSTPAQRTRFVGLALRALRRLHDAGALHGHPHASNIAIKSGQRAVLLDAKEVSLAGRSPDHRARLSRAGVALNRENEKLADLAYLMDSAESEGLYPLRLREQLLREHYFRNVPARAAGQKLKILDRIMERYFDRPRR